MVIGLLVILAAVIAGFVFTSPLTYGSPSLDVAAVNRRRILDTWTLVRLRSLCLTLWLTFVILVALREIGESTAGLVSKPSG
jgi:hypothetical protein